MDYQAMYQQKLTTPEEAVKVVKVRRLGGLHLVHQPPGGPGQGPGRPEGRAHRREDPGRRHHVDAGDRQADGRR